MTAGDQEIPVETWTDVADSSGFVCLNGIYLERSIFARLIPSKIYNVAWLRRFRPVWVHPKGTTARDTEPRLVKDCFAHCEARAGACRSSSERSVPPAPDRPVRPGRNPRSHALVEHGPQPVILTLSGGQAGAVGGAAAESRV